PRAADGAGMGRAAGGGAGALLQAAAHRRQRRLCGHGDGLRDHARRLAVLPGSAADRRAAAAVRRHRHRRRRHRDRSQRRPGVDADVCAAARLSPGDPFHQAVRGRDGPAGICRARRRHGAERACRGRRAAVPQRPLFRAGRAVAADHPARADARATDRESPRAGRGPLRVWARHRASAVRRHRSPDSSIRGGDAMISQTLWTLIAVQIALGAFDTLYHHELTERLAWRPSQRRELKLHGSRNLIYGALFLTLGWSEPHGALAMAVVAFLVVEVVITLWDFVEEDLTRKLPATERVTHTLLALNYGAILTLLLPVLFGWAGAATALVPAHYGLWSWFAGAAALGVALFGLRDLAARGRLAQLAPKPAAALVTALPRHRTILVTGATGFVGSRLVEGLAAAGHDTIVLTRDAAKAAALRPPIRIVTDLDQIDGAVRIDAIVHLAGEPVSGGLWTAARRRAIVESRAALTAGLAGLMARLERAPDVFVGASAIGWYGIAGDETFDETSEAVEGSFSHDSCAAVEREMEKVRALGVRTIALRIGLVLGSEGGLLARLLLPFEFGAGGRIGSGRQWMSWIARDDLVRLIV